MLLNYLKKLEGKFLYENKIAPKSPFCQKYNMSPYIKPENSLITLTMKTLYIIRISISLYMYCLKT